MAGDADPRHLGQRVMLAVGPNAVGPNVTGRRPAVGRIVVAGRAVDKVHGRTGRVAIFAGRPDPTFTRSLEVRTVAESTGTIQIPGGIVTPYGTHPEGDRRRDRMGGVHFVTARTFTAADQATPWYIKTRVTSRTAVKGIGMTLLAERQVGLRLRPVQSRVRERKRMPGAGAAGMTTGARPVGVGVARRKAARRRRIGWGPALGEIVADYTGCILVL
ncbi:MAG: hypothetical protein GTN81_07100 [Proteobacteria bacterium]|nr:hypothetical protein [Pseudomonadota bacterium]